MSGLIAALKGSILKSTPKENFPSVEESRFDLDVDIITEKFRGDLILPRDRDYNNIRKVWNRLIDKKPALIARCRGNL